MVSLSLREASKPQSRQPLVPAPAPAPAPAPTWQLLLLSLLLLGLLASFGLLASSILVGWPAG